MASSLGYSEINSNQTLTKIKENRGKNTAPRKITSAETEKLYKQLNNTNEDEDDGLPNLLSPPEISSKDSITDIEPNVITRQSASPVFHSKDIPKANSSTDNYVSSQEQFSTIKESYVPYTTLASNQPDTNNDSELMERINYMIYLLEEQKDEKTGGVHEEIILYAFLGVFVIFIVDSFARAGKYSR